jgi:cell fate (sporulation/competence/biofilm development) regulator YmcA (YheA/YmcA/DUF963 family)
MSTALSNHPYIEEKAQRIGDMVKRSLEMSVFKQAERDLHMDSEAQALMSQLQAFQGEEEQMEELLSRLERLDVVRRFTIAQEDLSEMVSHVTKILAATVSDRIDLVTEKEGSCASCPLTGCSGPTDSAAACSTTSCSA